MLIFWKAKLALLAVPKTGTTSLAHALAPTASHSIQSPPELKHAPLYRYDRFIRPIYEKVCDTRLETMAIMREPVSWLNSWYRYRKRDEMIGSAQSTRDITFTEFVNEYCKGSPAPFAHVGQQSKFLTNRPGSPAIDHLFKYESQTQILEFLETRLQQKINLPHLNLSPKEDCDLDPKIQRKLERKFAEDFALWRAIGEA